MAKWLGIGGIALGSTLIAVGVIGVVTFYEFIFGVTFWRDVLIFGAVAFVGAAMAVVAGLYLWRNRRRTTT